MIHESGAGKGWNNPIVFPAPVILVILIYLVNLMERRTVRRRIGGVSEWPAGCRRSIFI
jgi:hypothetical protein